MKKKHISLLRGIAVCVNAAAAAVLAVGFVAGMRAGYGSETWKEILGGKNYVETAEFQEQAASSVYDALEAAVRDSRMEKDGQYDPQRIIRLRDYLDNGTIYDEMPEKEKGNGICYRLGDLYQWSLKGTSYSDDVLNESYKPLFYGSIQEYCNECDEEYKAVVDQLVKSMKQIQREVALYQEQQKNWSAQATNVRYLLWDLGNGNVYTNVDSLQSENSQDTFAAYFKSLGSYYIYDSRTISVAQQNVGDYYSYNTHDLLEGWNIHLAGEYLVYVGIDTTFPATDVLSAAAQKYQEADQNLQPYILPMVAAAVLLVVTAIWILVLLLRLLWNMALVILNHAGIVMRVSICFVSYLLLQILLWVLSGKGVLSVAMLAGVNLVVLAVLVTDGMQRQKLLTAIQEINSEEGNTRISESGLFAINRQMAAAVNDLGDGLRHALQEQMKSERMKADLITNVSHDLKTPLTSIINYVDLLKREELHNEKANEYLEVLDQKSQRLKQLTEDLVEASRASSGNVVLDIRRIDVKELLMQTSGEFVERFEARGLQLIENFPQNPQYVDADGRRLWRIIENLFRNVEKYAMPHTRVYLDLINDGDRVAFSLKNISENPLNISPEELTERFTRGDESRSTEGSGLGLSIAKDLTEIQKGTFEIYLDGDLFKVTVSFPIASETAES
ncbi:sensor histidine kinase [Hominiventricola filiformis]|uniref:histidine kinase n=1 Tax=Hominiventricola filiformis TaxID=2885352 RepID=A0AAE3DB33_9FIRM|nr:HAMP domain-containing sensor histidine kinase [Hominiventricola filiformis]MCC2125855.1 HAMP domain-containing histidine kinase [Hominiventricola filiformis]